MSITHLLALVPLVVSFLIFVFIFRKGFGALAIVFYASGMIWFMFVHNWEWVAFPIVVIIDLISLFAFIKLAIEGDLT